MIDLLKLLGGEKFVYPGHPITIAYICTQVYSKLGDAIAPTTDNPHHALGNNDIPGAGGNVYAAISLIQGYLEGQNLDYLFDRADESWARCDNQSRYDPANWKAGQDQANSLKFLLRLALQK